MPVGNHSCAPVGAPLSPEYPAVAGGPSPATVEMMY